MKSYVEIGLESAMLLINHGPVVLVSTKDEKGGYDIAPVAWNCPLGKNPPRLLIVVGKRHRTCENITAAGEFIICVPHVSQAEMVRETGSVSGREIDKFDSMNIEAFAGSSVDAMIPEGCVGYLECKVEKVIDGGHVDIVAAEVLRAVVDKEAFDGRLLVEKEAGKTIHHLGDKIFAVPSDEVLDT